VIFVDTGAWIALTDASDALNAEAVAIYRHIVASRLQLLTTDYVLDETITRLRYDAGHSAALKFVDHVYAAQRKGVIQILHIDTGLFADAVVIFRKYADTVLSLTDCTSFAVCKRYGISSVFGFDRHYAMMSFSLLVAPQQDR
jgi:hypothetical protein